MATPADQRLLELLGRWLESLELHIKYSSLDDDSYWKIQPWSEHQRPSRWILELAKQKTLALRAQVEDDTDRMAAAPWQYLGEQRTEEVVRIGKAMSRSVLKAGAIPRAGVFPAPQPGGQG